MKKDYDKEFIREDKKKKDTPRTYTPGKDYVHTRVSRGKTSLGGSRIGYSRFQKKGRVKKQDKFSSIQGEGSTKGGGKERYYKDFTVKNRERDIGKHYKHKVKNSNTGKSETWETAPAHDVRSEIKSESKRILTTGKKKKKGLLEKRGLA